MSGQHWTDEEIDKLISLCEAGGESCTSVSDALSADFGRFISVNSVRFKAKELGYRLAYTSPEESPSEALSEPLRAITVPDFKYKPSTFEHFVAHKADLREMWDHAGLSGDQVFRLVVQSDTHCPYHDDAALSAFRQFLRYYKPHGLINIGDFGEFGPVSHWPANTFQVRRMNTDIRICREEMDKIDAAAGTQCKWKRFLVGNHEDWLDQYLVARVPELMDGLDEFGLDITVKKLLGLKERGYRVIPVNEILTVGHANFIHGWFTNQYHSKKHLDVLGANVYYGHTHDVQGHSNQTVRDTLEAHSLGCLRDLNARFLKGKPNKWVHAFGIFEFRLDGTYTVLVPKMIGGKFSFNGVLFDGTQGDV